MTQFLISQSVAMAVVAILLMGVVSWIYIAALALQKCTTRIKNLETTKCDYFWLLLLRELKNGFDDEADYSGRHVKHLIQDMISRME